MAQLLPRPIWWYKHPVTVLNTIEITMTCSNAHDARFVLNYWQEHQGTDFFKANCYFMRPFTLHDASEINK